MKFVKKNNIWYKHDNNSDKLYNFFHGWTNYDLVNDIEEEFENWHDLYKKTGWHPFIEKLARTPPPQLSSRWGMNCVIPITTCFIM